MKLLLAVTVLSLLLYSIQAANIPQDEEIKAVTDKEGQEVHAQFKRDNEESHAVTARSLSNITVTECHKTITGYNRPFYIQIVGNEVFLIEYGTKYVHVLDVKTGSWIRKFAVPVGHPKGLFVKSNRVLVTNVKKETYSFSLNGDLFGVHYSNQPVAVAVDYNGLMYTTEWTTDKINVFNIDGTKSHVINIGSTYPRKIQFDKQGNLYVGAHFSKAVFVYDRRGSLMRKISVPISYMDGIHLDPYDETIIYVADRKKGAGKVLKVKIATGEVIETYSGFSGASDVAVAPDGKLWVVDFEGNAIKIYNEENKNTHVAV